MSDNIFVNPSLAEIDNIISWRLSVMMKRCMLQNMPKNGKKTKTNWSRIVFAAFSKAQSNNVLRCLTKHCHRHNLSSFMLMIATN